MKKCFEYPNKRRYDTLQSAERDLLIIFDDGTLRAYHCNSCNGWHLTSTPENLKK